MGIMGIMGTMGTVGTGDNGGSMGNGGSRDILRGKSMCYDPIGVIFNSGSKLS